MLSANPLQYQPISCDFHDSLEALATTRKRTQIRFRDSNGALQHRSAIIIDLLSRDRAEYLVISTGETLRLDQLVEVDNTRLA